MSDTFCHATIDAGLPTQQRCFHKAGHYEQHISYQGTDVDPSRWDHETACCMSVLGASAGHCCCLKKEPDDAT